MSDKISVILPTHNEKGGIIPLIEEIHAVLRDYDHEIIVVDDNSPDGTYQAVVDFKQPYIKAFLRTEDPSLAKSIRCGLEKADGSIFIIMDSDFNHQPRYLSFMIQSLSFYDCVSATRFMYGGKMDVPIRHYLSWIFNIYIRVITGGDITDSLYGFIAIKRKTIEDCDYNSIFWGYGDYCIRLLYYLQKNKVCILQFPAINGKRRAGKGNSDFIGVFCQYFSEAIKLSFRGRIIRRFFKKRS